MSLRRGLIDPPRWTEKQLEGDRRSAIEDFRVARMREPLSAYIKVFENRYAVFNDLLRTTKNLADLRKRAVQILTDDKFMEAVRYLSGPPISADDLRVVADVPSLAAQPLRANPKDAQRLIETVMLGSIGSAFPGLTQGAIRATRNRRQPYSHQRHWSLHSGSRPAAAAKAKRSRNTASKRCCLRLA